MLDARVTRILIGLFATIIVLASPFVNPMVVGALGIVFAIILYALAKIRYFAIALAVLALLYGISFIPLLAFVGALAMILAGEGVRYLFRNFHHEIVFFGLGSTVALVFVMFYIGSIEPLVGALAEILLLMLRSILANRNDGSMISLIGVAMIITLFMDLAILIDLQVLAFAISLCAAFAYFAYRAKTIDLSGLFSVILFGIILIACTQGYWWFFIVLSFFILGSLFTKFKYAKKQAMGVAEKKSGRRGYKNAFANAVVGIVACIFFALTANPIFAVIFLASIATATADTMASEIGVISKRKPVMITTFKPCPPGLNGGVTLVGELACIGGSFIIAALGYAFSIVDVWGALAAFIAGFVGTNVDSLIGALFENKGRCGNAGTNLLATLIGGLVGAGIFALFMLL